VSDGTSLLASAGRERMLPFTNNGSS